MNYEQVKNNLIIPDWQPPDAYFTHNHKLDIEPFQIQFHADYCGQQNLYRVVVWEVIDHSTHSPQLIPVSNFKIKAENISQAKQKALQQAIPEIEKYINRKIQYYYRRLKTLQEIKWTTKNLNNQLQKNNGGKSIMMPIYWI